MKNEFENTVEYLNSPLSVLKGIGPKKALLFNKLGIFSVWDLIFFFPREYEDRRKIMNITECVPGEMCCIKVRPVRQISERRLKQKLSLFLLYASDISGYITVKWFSAPFCKPKLKSGDTLIVYGRLVNSSGKKEFEMHYMEKESEQKYTGVIVPVYHATNGLTSKTIADTVRIAFQNIPDIIDALPDNILKQNKFPKINQALKSMHFPENTEEISVARKRFAFEELLVMQLALFKLKSRRNHASSYVINASHHMREFSALLPFEFTPDQKATLNEICTDFKSGKPMNRLIQGDVGSGKTAVAAAAIYGVISNGYQAAFMAPTEILAVQHYETFSKILPDKSKIVLVTSSVKDKKSIYRDIADGKYDVVIGTHAIIEETVEFKNLALCVTDEQHRFGVNQRAALSSKGENPHVLVMSATPIPRTLSLILYGDLDVSVIKTLPKGRKSIDTFHVGTDKLERVYSFVKKQVENGFQCYIVCPLVESSESIDAANVEEKVEELKKGQLQGISISAIHGKMKAEEKDKIMSDFKSGIIKVLVSTTVIEVGVDVPNATLMVVENAERFGLSQLHQLRGRVGRGCEKSYCILVSDNKTEYGIARMEIMTGTNDGFVISQKDLELRGCGQFFGTRQHGLPELKIANLFSDIDILKEAQSVAGKILNDDPEMKSIPEIRLRINKLFDSFEDNNIFN